MKEFYVFSMYGKNKKSSSKHDTFTLEYKSRHKSFPHNKPVPCFLS